MDELVTIAAALGDKNRLRIVNSLLPGELCVCQILELLGIAPSTASQHLTVLRGAGLVESRKQGRWMYYRLAGSGSSPLVQATLRLVRALLGTDAEGLADAKRLSSICSIEPEVLCCNQRNSRCCSPSPGRKSGRGTAGTQPRRTR